MKKTLTFLTILIATLAFGPAIAQKKLTEATITYNIVVNTNNSSPQAADMMDGAVSVIYLKGNASRTDISSSLGQQSTIIDGETGKVTILKVYGAQKYMINMTPADWKSSNSKYDAVTFTYANEFKTIGGYSAQKATGKLSDGTTFTVYFTKDLMPVNKDFQYLNKELPGLALEYEATLGKQKVTYTMASINFNLVAASKFDLPKSGYRVMTYAETQTKKN